MKKLEHYKTMENQVTQEKEALEEMIASKVDLTCARIEVQERLSGDRKYFSEEAQLELVASYQLSTKLVRALKAGEIKESFAVKSLIREGQDSGWHLVESCRGLVASKIKEATKDRGTAFSDYRVELKAETDVFILETAVNFDKEKNSSFGAFLNISIKGFISVNVRKSVHTGEMSQAWERVIRKIRAITTAASAEHRVASKKEILSKVDEGFDEWAENHLDENEQLLKGDEREEAKKRRLSKQGMPGARKEIDRLIILAEGEESLDQFTAEGLTIGDRVIASENVESSVMDVNSEWMLERVYAVALGDKATEYKGLLNGYHGLLGVVEGDASAPEEEEGTERKRPWSLTRISSHTGAERTNVRNMLKDNAQSRLSAPHAQFAHLAPGLLLQVEEEPSDAFSQVRALPREMFAE